MTTQGFSIKSALVAAAIATATAGTALAQSLPQGCFARDYSAAHLSGQPAQVVEAIRVNFMLDGNTAEVAALMANQGHAARDGFGGQTLTAFTLCEPNGRCFVECDGGSFTVSRNDGDMIEIQTSYFRVGTSGCDGSFRASDLAEVFDQVTTYRLFRADPSACPSIN